MFLFPGGQHDALVDNLVTTNLVASYRADTEITESGGVVSGWGDPVGGHDLAEATDKPEFNASGGPNNQPFIGFDTDAKRLVNATIDVANPCHLFFCLRQVTWVLNAYIFRDTASNPYCLQGTTTPGLVHSGQGGQGNQVNLTLGTWVLFESFFNNATNHFQRVNNGSKADSYNTGSANLTGFKIGDVSGPGAIFDVAEIAIYGTAEVTGSSLTQNLAHFNDRYTLGL